MNSSGSDLVVVGAGVFGAWTALLAARAGYSVRLIDQHGPANPLGSSAGESRIIRMAYGDDEIYTALSAKALPVWRRFFEERGISSCFRRTGVLWMAAAQESGLTATQRAFERLGIVHEILDGGELRKRYPQINIPEETRGIFEPESGALLAERSVAAVVSAAVEGGADIQSGRVEPITQAAGRLESIKTEDARRLRGDIFVFACGSWLPEMFPHTLAGLIAPTRQEFFFFESATSADLLDPAKMPIWIDQTDVRLPYGFPDLGNVGVKLGFHRLGPTFDPDTGDRTVTEQQIAEAAAYLSTRFSFSSQPLLKSTRVCHYENTSTGDFVIDRHPSLENVWIVGGGSGHGFKHGPIVAETLLSAIDRGHMEEARFTIASKTSMQPGRVI